MHPALQAPWTRFRALPAAERRHATLALGIAPMLVAAHFGGSYPVERWSAGEWVILVLIYGLLASTAYTVLFSKTAIPAPAQEHDAVPTPESDRYFRRHILPLVAVSIAMGVCLGYLFAKL